MEAEQTRIRAAAGERPGSGRDGNRLQLVRLEHAHGLTMPGNDILHRRRDVLWLPQPSCASMACPSLSVRRIQAHPVQTAAGVSFEAGHNSLWRNLCFDHRVHAIASHVGRQQTPASMHAHLPIVSSTASRRVWSK